MLAFWVSVILYEPFLFHSVGNVLLVSSLHSSRGFPNLRGKNQLGTANLQSLFLHNVWLWVFPSKCLLWIHSPIHNIRSYSFHLYFFFSHTGHPNHSFPFLNNSQSLSQLPSSLDTILHLPPQKRAVLPITSSKGGTIRYNI